MTIRARFWNQLLPVLLAMALITVADSVSPAPAAPGPGVSDRQSTLVEYFRAELHSNDQARRARALVDVIALTNCSASCIVALQSLPDKVIRIENETGVGAAMDLTGLVPDLVRVYRSGPSDGHRLLALSALLHIGDESGIESLIRNPVPVSPKVERATQQQLVGFYLNRYPELTTRTLRLGTLSLDDVRTARDRQARALRQQMRNR